MYIRNIHSDVGIRENLAVELEPMIIVRTVTKDIIFLLLRAAVGNL